MTREGATTAMLASIRLTVEPATSSIDEPVRLAVSGVPAGAAVTLRVSTSDGARQVWESSATYLADADGIVDATTAEPVEGGYVGVDGTGLLWSMSPANRTRPVFFNRRRPTPLTFRATAEIAGEQLASREFVRTFGDPALTGSAVPARTGLVGTLFAGPAAGPVPGILLLSGSDGGQYDQAAALLASHGYAVLSLTYFGAEDTPPHLNHIDLDYFVRAVDWLAEQPGVDAAALAVIGLSRGGELALQLGARDPRLTAVIAASPSDVRQAGLTEKYTDFTQPAWVLGGEALPFVPGRYGPRQFLGFVLTWLLRRPMRQRAMFDRLTRPGPVVDAATIEVERIAGPVLLISGSDDQLWPSERYAERVAERLRRHGHPYGVENRLHRGAGHFVSFPYGLPTMPPMTRLSPVAGLTIDFGGTAAANAAAAEASWRQILAFLHRFREGAHPDR